MRTIIIIQARMGSSRLPGKVLLPVLERPLLYFLIERLRRVRKADGILIATTQKEADLPIVNFAVQHQVPVYRGPEHDVLSRYYDAAMDCQAELIVRVTADCPVVDPAIIDGAIAQFQESEDFDYVSNTQKRSFPRGLDVEVFSMDALRTAYEMAVRWEEREHVTPFIYNRPERFRIGHLTQDVDETNLRWTVDTKEDFHLMREIITALYPEDPRFSLESMRALINARPELKTLNQHIVQKA